MEFLKKFEHATQEELREILKNVKFKKIEDINGFKRYYGKDGFKEYELMEFPWENDYFSICYNYLVYTGIRKDYVNIK